MRRTRGACGVLAWSLGAWIAGGVVGASAWAQPTPPPPGGGMGNGGRPGVQEAGMGEDHDAIVARLERRLADLEREREHLRGAVEKIRQGADPADVRRELGGPGGPGGPRLRERLGERMGDRRERLGPGGPGGPGAGGPEGRPRFGPEGGRVEEGSRLDRGRGGEDEFDPERLKGVLREHMPQLSEFVGKLPEEARERVLRRIGPRVREALALKERDPKLFELKAAELRGGVAVMSAARSARELSRAERDGEAGIAEKRDGAKKALREAVSEQFDTRAALQRHEVELLSARLDALKERVSKLAAERDAKIDEMVRRVLEGGEPAADR